MDFCKQYVRVAWSHQPGNICLFTRLRCRSWGCEYCARKNAAMWRNFLAGQLPIISDNWWMVTLTAHSETRTLEASYQNLQRGVGVALKRIRRCFSPVEYVRVYEKHPQSNAIHAHLLVSGLTEYVSWRMNPNKTVSFKPQPTRPSRKGYWHIRTYLSKQAHESKIGYSVAVERCRDRHAVFYVTKYLTKSAQEISIKGLRHVSTSHRVGSPGNESGNRWEVGNFITSLDVRENERVQDVQKCISLSYREMVQYGVYPPETERVSVLTPPPLTKNL